MFKDIIKLSSLPIIVASLCCLSPVILFLTGLSTAAIASSFADTLYGDYKWAFRIAGLVLLCFTVYKYLRQNKGICTLDQVKRRKNEVLNIIIIFLIIGIIGHIIFLYGIVHYFGVFLGLWS
jgi:hypothetical protein